MNRSQITGHNADLLRQIFHSEKDAYRCYGSLAKFTRHIKEPVMITGSIAAGWHTLKGGKVMKERKFNDLDVVVDNLYSLRATLREDFLIRHFHPNRGEGKILVMLVDEEYRTRIDVFTPVSTGLKHRSTDCQIGELLFKVVSAEDLLAKLLGSICQVIKNEPVEIKYVDSFNRLYEVADVKMMRGVWQEYRKESDSDDFIKVIEATLSSIAANPALLQTSRYSQNLNEKCSWCCESDIFPLSPPSRVYEILGYV
jgi:hypothetical protein